MATNSTLTALILGGNQVGAEGAGRFAKALSSNSILTTLDLSANSVGEEGAGRLAGALAINSTLTILNLYKNLVKDEGAGRLTEAMATNSTLTRFDLNWDSNTRLLVDAYLDRNKGNLEKKSASLFFMLLPALFLDSDVPSE